MHPDPPDQYFLGGDGADDADDDDPERDRRTRRGALIGLAVAIVIVALAITLTSVLVDTSSTSSGPRAAVQRWSDTLAHGDSAGRRRLECAAPTDLGDALTRLLVGSHYRVSTGAARSQGADRWSVPLQVDSPDGSSPVASTSVTVVREAGRYLIC